MIYERVIASRRRDDNFMDAFLSLSLSLSRSLSLFYIEENFHSHGSRVLAGKENERCGFDRAE